ncbi:Nitrogen permease regulator 3 [Lecanora helva]
MSTLPLPPNPCLVAIMLVVKTSSDPSIVFHYPPRPGEDNSRFQNLFKETADDETTSSSSDDDSTGSAVETGKTQKEVEGSSKKDSPPDADIFGSASPEKSGALQPEQRWNDLFKYQSSVLAKVLTPALTGNKKRFEVGLGEKVFLGRPVFARPDGTWKKPKKKKRRSSSKSNVTNEKSQKDGTNLPNSTRESMGIEEKDYGDASAESQSDAVGRTKAQTNVPEMTQTRQSEDGSTGKKSKRSSNGDASPHIAKKPLKMFHLVCVLQPPPLEYHIRVGEMYDHIVRKFSKALKWEQSRSNYVANEASLISSVTKSTERTKDGKHFLSTLYRELLAQSSLAKAIATLHNSISNLRIAQLALTPLTSLSLQIPVATFISSLPTLLSPQLPGLWLTTANATTVDDETQTTGTQLGSHFTLLLLTDLHSILVDVSATSSPITDALTHYLRVTTSTKSFYQISQSSGISLHDIQFLASHLIYWRRARAIPPLHQRDTYIVSPNADMRKLSYAAPAFSKTFPALPPLPHILSVLSSRLRPWSSLIPSKDHKAAYMDILAWLMRGGWVTQLRTFAWVRVPSDIKESVEKQKLLNGSDKSPEHSTTDASESTEESDQLSRSSRDVPHPSPRSMSPSPPNRPTSPSAKTGQQHSPDIIPNPHTASDPSSRHLSAISAFILEQQGPDSHSAWLKCIKYFDGKHALETIPVREGWKRKQVRELLDGWVEMGLLVRARHW